MPSHWVGGAMESQRQPVVMVNGNTHICSCQESKTGHTTHILLFFSLSYLYSFVLVNNFGYNCYRWNFRDQLQEN